MNNSYLKREGLYDKKEGRKKRKDVRKKMRKKIRGKMNERAKEETYNPYDIFQSNPVQNTQGLGHRYVLKTSTFPPVNTKQYVYVDQDDDEYEEDETLPKGKCQPCPPCGRCPEPAFECKKVPNYNSNNNKYLPRAVLADFSQFGM
jgi:hypothetical protein